MQKQIWLPKMSLTIIAALSENNVIGDSKGVPWHISEDLKRFRQLTLNHPVIMGRKTFESILGKPLPKRKNIVLTRQDISYEGVTISHSIEEALNACGSQDSYIIGGGQIYRQFFPLVNKMEITRVHRNIEGHVFFPEVNWEEWREIKREDKRGYSFLTYRRI